MRYVTCQLPSILMVFPINSWTSFIVSSKCQMCFITWGQSWWCWFRSLSLSLCPRTVYLAIRPSFTVIIPGARALLCSSETREILNLIQCGLTGYNVQHTFWNSSSTFYGCSRRRLTFCWMGQWNRVMLVHDFFFMLLEVVDSWAVRHCWQELDWN